MSGLDIPDTVNAADVTSWSDEVDVLVIGFGIAGGCAAVSAAAAGANVMVLEKAAAAGGTSAMAGGHFYLGGGTAVQQATGHEDSADEMYKYLVAVSGRPRPRQDPLCTAKRASSTSIGLKRLAFSLNAATGRARWWSRPAPRGCATPATKGVAVLREGHTLAARTFSSGAGGVGRRRHGHRPARQARHRSGRRIRYETGVTTRWPTARAWSGVR